MTKVELLKEISNKSVEAVNQKQVASVLAALEAVVKDVVTSGNEVTVPGICKVKEKIVKEKTGTIMMGPNKGEKYVKPEHKEASVKIVKSLKTIFA